MSRPLRLPGNLQHNMHQSRTCLIIAQSGRALAKSARMGGWTAHVLDRFADQDTHTNALSCVAVSGNASGFSSGELLKKLAIYYGIPLYGVIYGSGLEENYDVLEFLGRHWTLLGNEAAVVRTCKEPALFFPMLSRLGIPHPYTCLTIPPKCNGDETWIVKQTGAAGGGHIRAMSADIPAGPNYYFQKKLSGRSLSVVFIANSANAIIVGLNEMWTVAPVQNDFRYSGAVTGFHLPKAITQSLELIVNILVKELGLRGLCGMDVIVGDNAECHVLELNPRPTATFELHQTEHSLCAAHILACEGKLPSLPHNPDIARAHQVLYADRDFILPDFTWPDWTSDRPYPGRHIMANDPVCMVHAKVVTVSDVRAQLQHRSATLMRLMGLQKLAA